MKPRFDGVLILIEILYIIIIIFGIEFACEETIRFLDTGGIDMSEEWIEILKNGSIGAAIGAAASLVGSYFMYLGKSKKILEIVQELKGEKFNQIREDSREVSRKSDKLSTEHDKLSTEHDKLREELYKIYLNQEKEKAAKEGAARKLPEEGKLLDLVKIVYDNHTKMTEKNMELMQEVERLKAELAQYRQHDRWEDIELSEYEIRDDEMDMER
ncbi:MAG: hypothetical protein HFJ06_01760 [Lachnospiraceae bacterium]|nr:hypothetical protein [Lachnospiraceae bacterium]